MVEIGEGQGQRRPFASREIVDVAAIAEARGHPGEERSPTRREHGHVRSPAFCRLAQGGVQLRIDVEDLRARGAAERATAGHEIGAEDGCSREREGLAEQAADGAQPDDERGVARHRAGALDRAQATGQRLDERRRLVAHAGGKGEGRVLDIGGGHPAELREAAGVEIDALEGAAHGRAAAPAVVAAEAGHVMGHDHALADAESRDGGAHRDHLAHHLVAEDGGRPRVGAQDLQDVRAAEATAAHPHEQLARPRDGLGPVAQLEVAWPPVHRRLHA